MYSNEFMKFLFSYQKDEFCKKTQKCCEIKFNSKSGGKPAEVLISVENK
ncbi:hypothetical protein J6I39_08295 [bacterium]|nr:hypothetical protein [bacterium]